MTRGLEIEFLKRKTKHDNISRSNMLRDSVFPIKYNFNYVFET